MRDMDFHARRARTLRRDGPVPAPGREPRSRKRTAAGPAGTGSGFCSPAVAPAAIKQPGGPDVYDT